MNLPTELRRICGHDSNTVEGCTTCEAADRIEELEAELFTYQTSMREANENRMKMIELAEKLQARMTEQRAIIALHDLEISLTRSTERERCIDRALAWWAITEDLDAIPTDVAAEGIRAALEERHQDLDLNPQP